MSHLQGGKVDVSQIQTISRNNLISLLEKCQGSKVIVWGSNLSPSVDLIIQNKYLVELGVIKMYPLRKEPLPANTAKHVIFISRPRLHCMDLIAQTVHRDSNTLGQKKKTYHLFFIPKNSLLCRNRLEKQGLGPTAINIEEFKCDLFPFDSDVISMEIPEVFGEYYLQNDPTTLYQIAQALITLQRIYGPIPRICGKGQTARQVWDLVKRLERQNNLEETYLQISSQNSVIDQIVLLDRSIDLISPLATQLTYEGLVDEIFGLKNTMVAVPAEKLKSGEDAVSESLGEAKTKAFLNSGDKLFADIRDKNFNAVGAFLSEHAKQISAQLNERHEKSVQEIKVFVQKLPALLAKKNALSLHTAIAECIKETTDSFDFLDALQTEQEFLNCIDVDKANQYIEDLIAQKAPIFKVLRLVCLQCLASSGLKPKILEYYKREIVQVYGIEALLALVNLEKAGLLKVQAGIRQYAVLRKTLRLTVEDTSEIDPKDISYVHSIYAPLTVRLMEQLIKNDGWKQLQDVLGLLPGPHFEDARDEIKSTSSKITNPRKSILVFFIGGCTFAEISALRFLSIQENVDIVVGTTKMINGNTFLESIIDIDKRVQSDEKFMA